MRLAEILPANAKAAPQAGWRFGAGERRLILLGLLLLALTLAALAVHAPGDISVGPPPRRAVFVGLLGAAALVQFAAIATVWRGVPARAVWVIAVLGLALRIGPLLAPPFLSTDIYRYVWDGRVQAAGVNPYLYVPADAALAPLRDAAVYPNINRFATAPTIYAPTAQLVFAAVGLAAPGVTAMKATMIGFEALALAAAGAVLSRLGLPMARLIVWAWNPLAIWAFAGNGHVDAIAIGLLSVALLLLGGKGRGRRAGIAFGAAVLVKFLPLVIAPVLWPRGRRRAASATLVTIIVLYAFYAGAGRHVLGFLTDYPADEGLSDGSGVWLLAGLSYLTPLPHIAGTIYAALAASGIAILAAWVAFVWRPADDKAIWQAAGVLMAAVTFAISPHYPWYFAWLALPAIVAPSRALIWLGTAPVLLYINPFEDRFIWASLVYLPALALALRDVRRPSFSARPLLGATP
jgi:hypothetical protein